MLVAVPSRRPYLHRTIRGCLPWGLFLIAPLRLPPLSYLLPFHQVPKVDGTTVSWHDIAVGEILTLYSRSYYVTGADPFTRKFYSERGIEVCAAQSPLPHTRSRQTASLQSAAFSS